MDSNLFANELKSLVSAEHQHRISITIAARSAFQRAFARPFVFGDDPVARFGTSTLKASMNGASSTNSLGASMSFAGAASSSAFLSMSGSMASSMRGFEKGSGGSLQLVLSYGVLDRAVRDAVAAEMAEAAGVDTSRREMSIEADRRTRQLLVELNEQKAQQQQRATDSAHSSPTKSDGVLTPTSAKGAGWSRVLPALRERPASAMGSSISTRLSPRTIEIMSRIRAPSLAEQQEEQFAKHLATRPDNTEALNKLAMIRRRREYRLSMRDVAVRARAAQKEYFSMESTELSARYALWNEEMTDGVGAVYLAALVTTEALRRVQVQQEELAAAVALWATRSDVVQGFEGLCDLHQKACFDVISYNADALKRDEAIQRCHVILEERATYFEIITRCQRGISEEDMELRRRQNAADALAERRRSELRADDEAEALRTSQLSWLQKQREQLAIQRARVEERVNRKVVSEKAENEEVIEQRQHNSKALLACEAVEEAARQALSLVAVEDLHATVVVSLLDQFDVEASALLKQMLRRAQLDDAAARQLLIEAAKASVLEETNRRVEAHALEEHEAMVRAMQAVIDRNRIDNSILKEKRMQRLTSRQERILRVQKLNSSPHAAETETAAAV